MVDWLAARSLWAPVQAVRRRIKKWGADRQALIREGSEVVTPVIELAQEVGPVGVVWGNKEQIDRRFADWAEEWDELRTRLLTYANYHPSEKVKSQAEQVCTAVVAAFGATRFLSLRGPTSETMDAFNAATERQNEAVDRAKELLETIRRY